MKSKEVARIAFFLCQAHLCLVQLCLGQNLPVKKVVLYKNGLGYFEHNGSVTGNQSVEIVLPSAQLDDVLKSLTVIDRGRGQIAGITYDSAESLERRLADLPVQINPSQGLVDFLNKIPGAEVEIPVAGVPVAGRLMGAEIRQKKAGEYVIGHSVQVNILTARGEVRSIDLPASSQLKIVKADLAAELRDYLTLLDSAHQRDSRRLKIQANGTGERGLLVSYTAEAPIWKTTYRLVLDAGKKPLLQGWAIVDNTTANEWNGVELSLVSGMPVSFIQKLSQPIYGRRPTVPIAEGEQVTPQTHQATLETPSGASGIAGVVKDASESAVSRAIVSIMNSQGAVVRQLSAGEDGRFSANLAPGAYKVSFSSAGFAATTYNITVNAGRTASINPTLKAGSSSQVVEVQAEAATTVMTSTSASERIADHIFALRKPPPKAPAGGVGFGLAALPISDLIRESAFDSAQAQPVGDQFEYKLRQPVTIHRNESALLPIVSTEIAGDKVSLYSEGNGDRCPRFAIWLNNSSGLTLDAGSFNVIEGGAFAGEGLTATIHPGERRLLSYALDSALEVSADKNDGPERFERVTIAGGVMTQIKQVREKRTYVIRNNDDKSRAVVVEHPARSGWTLVDTPPPAESSAGFHRFRIDARPKATTEFTVQESKPLQTTYEIADLDADRLALWVRTKVLDREMEKTLQEVVRRKAELDELQGKGEIMEAEIEEIGKDQARMRDNLSKLNSGNKDEANLRQRYIKQMEQQEDRLAQIKTEGMQLAQTLGEKQKALVDYIQKIAFERKL